MNTSPAKCNKKKGSFSNEGTYPGKISGRVNKIPDSVISIQ